MPTKRKIIAPQRGPQTEFLTCPADCVWAGGSAGGGKTFSTLLDAVRHINNPNYGATIFRAQLTQITVQGGLKDASHQLYPYLGGRYAIGNYRWTFPQGSRVDFRYLASYEDCLKWQGSELPAIYFEELSHWKHGDSYWYMFSRNRSTCGVRPIIRATMNPADPDSWITQFIDWWIGDDGFIIPERSGKIRWFIRANDEFVWANDPDDLLRYNIPPKSFTFIRSSVHFNQKLLKVDPGYLANLQALPRIDRLRLLEGNWKIKATSGMVFDQTWFKYCDWEDLPFNPAKPDRNTAIVRFWDFAATQQDYRPPTKGSKKDGPCYTAGVWMAYHIPNNTVYILDVSRSRLGPAKLDQHVVDTASNDGYLTKIRTEMEPGSSGIRDAYHLTEMLRGYDHEAVSPAGDKLVRCRLLSAWTEQGRTVLVHASWNKPFVDELHGVPDDNPYWDQTDAANGAFEALYDTIRMHSPTPVFKTAITAGM